jgi:UDP-2,3-diacylglucosamine hydrolase
MKAYFVSDIHLCEPNEPNARIFAAFLRELARKRAENVSDSPSHLFLVGDIFDLWVGGHRYFRDKFTEIVDAIKHLVDLGVEVHFFEGNHDLHLTDFWQRELGVHVHEDAQIFNLYGKKVRIEHGDLINPEDKGYLFLKSLLHTRVIKALSLNLPSFIVRAIGERASKASRTQNSSVKELSADLVRTLIREHVKKVFNDGQFDLIITGHVHVRDDSSFRIGQNSVRSINLGSWFEDAKVFVLSRETAEFSVVNPT